MKKIFNRKKKNTGNNYYRLFNRYNGSSENVDYQEVVNSIQFGYTIKKFLDENSLDSMVYTDILPKGNGDEAIITLVGSNQIMQLNEKLYNLYKLEIEGKLKETMNYEVIRNLITSDTEFILNFCSKGLIYSDDKHDQIAKVYMHMSDSNSINLMNQFVTKLFSDENSLVVINNLENKKVKVTCGAETLLLNRKMYEYISYDIYQHNRNVKKQKKLIKK